MKIKRKTCLHKKKTRCQIANVYKGSMICKYTTNQKNDDISMKKFQDNRARKKKDVKNRKLKWEPQMNQVDENCLEWI